MPKSRNKDLTLGDLVAAVSDEVEPLTRSKRKANVVISVVLQDLFMNCRVRFKNGNGLAQRIFRRQQRSANTVTIARRKWPAVAFGMLLYVTPVPAFAGTASDQLRQSVEKIQTVLSDPSLKGEAKAAARRQQLKEIIHHRFDFQEMAKRSLGAQWQKRTPAEQKEFVRLFTELLESSYLGRLEEYNGEKVRFVNEREEKDFAEVNTKLVSKAGEEFALDYRLNNFNGEWKVSDVVIENISLVNNYRSQFARVLSKSSFEELVQTLKQKKPAAPGSNS